MTLLLTESDVRSLLTMDMALEAVEEAFRGLHDGSAVNHSRRRIAMARGMLHYMASVVNARQVIGLKVYTTFGGKTDFFIPLYNSETGRLLAIIEGDWLGRLRTGAASGVATKYMARPDARTLGLIGTGGQARMQLLAICAVRPIERVHVYSRSAENREAFAAEMQPQIKAKITVVDNPKAAVEGMKVIATMTSAGQPVFNGEWISPGAHINAAGCNHIKRREIDGATVKRSARVAIDSVEQGKMECGDLAAAAAEGLIRWEEVIEFSDIVGGARRGRESADEITLFESQGLSVWDVAAAARVYTLAVERGLGQKLPLFE